MSDKTALDFDFDEFINWAVGYITLGIGEGQKLKDLVLTVVDHALRNRKFGKESKRENTAAVDEAVTVDYQPLAAALYSKFRKPRRG